MPMLIRSFHMRGLQPLAVVSPILAQPGSESGEAEQSGRRGALDEGAQHVTGHAPEPAYAASPP